MTGELLTGRRAHELPASTDPIQNCWKVAWAETDAMKAAEAAREAWRCILDSNRDGWGEFQVFIPKI